MECLSNSQEIAEFIETLIFIFVSTIGVYGATILGLELGGIIQGNKGRGMEIHKAFMKAISDLFKDKK
jgi:hypothetical protein